MPYVFSEVGFLGEPPEQLAQVAVAYMFALGVVA